MRWMFASVCVAAFTRPYSAALSPRLSLRVMIRREPTRIPMEESDVQDMKDYLAQKKAAAAPKLDEEKDVAAAGDASGSSSATVQLPVDDKQRKKEMREARLGMR